MRRRALVIGVSLLTLFGGIILIAVSNISEEAPVQYKEALGEPLEGNEIEDMGIYLPYAGRCGIDLTGSYQGSAEHPIFIIKDYAGIPIFSSPSFPPPSHIMEFDIENPGFYSFDFTINVTDDSRLELYQYRYRMEDIRPHVQLYYVGIPTAILGVAGITAGLFMSSNGDAVANKRSGKTKPT